MKVNCVMCDKEIDIKTEDYELGESFGEFWCIPCAEKESDTGEIY